MRGLAQAALLLCACVWASGCSEEEMLEPGVSTRDRVRGDGGLMGSRTPRRVISGGSSPAKDPAAGASAPPPASGGRCALPERPVDVIFTVDTSGSMAEEIAATERNLNDNFAAILDAAGVDYRLILIGEHGQSDDLALRICIAAPLGGGSCTPPPAAPQNTERFRHYSTLVSSLDSLCLLLDTQHEPDTFGLAPAGWASWLREGALKVFVEVTDDGVGCASLATGALFPLDDDPELIAETFDAELRRLAPEQFGSDAPDYRFYSIVGQAHAAAPAAPLVTEPCASAVTPGLEYQALSVLTGAGRWPVCDGTSFPEAFAAIADEVVKDVCQRP